MIASNSNNDLVELQYSAAQTHRQPFTQRKMNYFAE
jgi:hypothetical protein